MARVLIIDDERGIQYTLSEFLKMEDHTVATAGSVEEGTILLKEQDFDVIVLDVVLPKISGIEFLETIREQSEDVQVILISGEPTVKTAIKAMRMGAFDFLSKPISGNVICRVVKNAAAVKTLKDENRRLLEENIRHREHLEDLVAQQTSDLQDSEKRFKRLSEATFEAIIIHDVGTIIDMNPTAVRMFGFDVSEVIGRNVAEFVHADDRELAKDRIVQNQDTLYTDPFELRIISKSGDIKPVEIRSKLTPYKGRRVHVTAARDLSERNRARRKLEESEERYRRLTENLPDMIWRTSFSGEVLYVNRAVERLLGISQEAALGMQIQQYMADESIEKIRQHLSRVLADTGKGDSFRTTVEYIHEQGLRIPCEINVTVLRDENGKAIHLEGITRDISQRRMAEAQQAKYLALIESRREFVGITTLEGRLTYINRAGRKMIGLREETDISAIRFPELVAVGQPHFLMDDSLNETGLWQNKSQMTSFIDGSPFPVAIEAFIVTDPNTNDPLCIGTVIRKITKN